MPKVATGTMECCKDLTWVGARRTFDGLRVRAQDVLQKYIYASKTFISDTIGFAFRTIQYN